MSSPPPPYDPSAALDGFRNMRISDPFPRAASAMSQPPADPIPRTGTPMSVRSAQSPQHSIPRHSLPASPDQGVPRRFPPGRPDGGPLSSDMNSVHSGGSGNSVHNSVYSDGAESLAYDGSAETDVTSMYSYEDHQGYAQYPQNGYPPQDGQGYARGYPQQGWQGQYQGYAQPQHPGIPPQEYGSLYAAASNVLGMGPPPGAPGAPPPRSVSVPYPPNGSPYSPYSHQYPPQQMPPNGLPPQMSPNGMPPQMPPNGMYQQMPPNGMPPQMPPNGMPPQMPPSASYLGPYQTGPPSVYSGSGQSSYAPSIPPTDDDDKEIEFRPALNRAGTTDLATLRTEKTKAIDLSAPPFTKQYIDEYRHRIKDDPDPEAQFAYAKYLIEAAKRIGGDKDQRSVKKYRDSLIAEALKVIRRLATQGEAYDEAQFFLANCHGTGMLGLQVDHERAYHLYLQAAKQNHAAACYRVAVCNEIGAGTRKEPQRAAAFYRKAASLGDTAAMYKLGTILLRGSLGMNPNPREAVGWLKRAAEQADEENPHALHELAVLHEQPQSQVVPYDPAYAKELYTRAAHLGYTHAQYKLGQCYEYGALTCPTDPRRSIAWYTKAAERGHPEAELALSGWYLTGSEGVLKQSDAEAYLWARRAGNKGLSKAEYAVGYYSEVGIGTKQDIEIAKRWYMRAAGACIPK